MRDKKKRKKPKNLYANISQIGYVFFFCVRFAATFIFFIAAIATVALSSPALLFGRQQHGEYLN